MKIYAISGLGADERVYKFLNLDADVICIAWIRPIRHESLQDYAIRLAENIDTTEAFGLMGVSFGGMIAVEIAKRLNPTFTVLISSAETKNELRWIYRLAGRLKIIKLMPEKMFDLPRWIASLVFGTSEGKLLNQILDDTDLVFTKWAAGALTGWKNVAKLSNRLKIHGTKDKLIPFPKTDREVVPIKNAGHFAIVDRAGEITEIINKFVQKQT